MTVSDITSNRNVTKILLLPFWNSLLTMPMLTRLGNVINWSKKRFLHISAFLKNTYQLISHDNYQIFHKLYKWHSENSFKQPLCNWYPAQIYITKKVDFINKLKKNSSQFAFRIICVRVPSCVFIQKIIFPLFYQFSFDSYLLRFFFCSISFPFYKRKKN